MASPLQVVLALMVLQRTDGEAAKSVWEGCNWSAAMLSIASGVAANCHQRCCKRLPTVLQILINGAANIQ
jgi:hypothetical protein